jgi:hypothetical protein
VKSVVAIIVQPLFSRCHRGRSPVSEDSRRRIAERTGIIDHRTGSSHWTARRVLLVALPFLAILLSVLVWIASVSRSGFWADDFANLTHYNRSLGDLSNEQLNKGKYIINLFWAVGTQAFGTGSVVPFLILTSTIFAAGLVVWLQAGARARWSSLDAWWIGGLFIATAAWFPIALWSSNITHSAAFLALGVGYLAHERCMSARTLRAGLLWSLVGGVAWTLAIVSNLLYLGVLVIAGYCTVHQVVKLRRLGLTTSRIGVAVSSWNLIIPLIYFATIAYPATTASSVYANNGLQFVHANFRYYRAGLAPSILLSALYVVLLVVGIAGGIAAARRRDWFPLSVLAAAGAIAVPAFIQSQQRGVQYLAMPLLLTFSACAAGAHPVLLSQARRGRGVGSSGAVLLAAAFMLVLVFRQGTDVRSFFVQTPMGGSLAAFRTQASALTPEGGTVCATLALEPPAQALLNAEMSGEDGFVVPPISAARAYLVAPGQTCPAQGPSSHITISLNPRGSFSASR